MFRHGSHSFLNTYIHENSCRRIMEIGVFNGDNARTMVKAAIDNSPAEEVEYYGFDFFSGLKYLEVKRKLEKTGCKFELFRGDTVDTLPKAARRLPKMDLIFIDAGKSYMETQSDWESASTLMHNGTAVFVHNYEFTGVRQVVDTIPRNNYQVEIIHPSSEESVALIRKTS